MAAPDGGTNVREQGPNPADHFLEDSLWVKAISLIESWELKRCRVLAESVNPTHSSFPVI